MRAVCMLMVIVMLLSGCADMLTREKVEVTLTKGSTTKQEVQAFFGKPLRKYKNPGMKMTAGKTEQVVHGPFEVWIYSLHETQIADLLEAESLRIIFNEAGIVSNYEYKDDGD